MLRASDYDYPLPADLIAQYPLAERSAARMMVVDRARNSIEHSCVRDLPLWLEAGDCLVLNDTRVVPARLIGFRTATGGRWEGLFLSAADDGCWQLLGKTRGRLRPGETVTLRDHEGRESFTLTLLTQGPGGVWTARPAEAGDPWMLLERVGRVPLPHYIRHGQMAVSDRARYQTVFARHPGSAAAPTAGLHFTPQLLTQLIDRGLDLVHATLHVGLDTFRPLAVEDLAEHVMHHEWCELRPEVVARLLAARERGGRIVAVGTTAVRVLESAARDGGLAAFRGETELFIRPPYEFRATDALLTNFHLPRSTLLVLVRTFGGDELLRRAYQAAIDAEYRFYSYGDCMLIR